jgi:hypothetical protein
VDCICILAASEEGSGHVSIHEAVGHGRERVGVSTLQKTFSISSKVMNDLEHEDTN